MNQENQMIEEDEAITTLLDMSYEEFAQIRIDQSLTDLEWTDLVSKISQERQLRFERTIRKCKETIQYMDDLLEEYWAQVRFKNMGGERCVQCGSKLDTEESRQLHKEHLQKISHNF